MSDLIVGLGEVGRPLYELLREAYLCYGKDLEAFTPPEPVTVLHICYPYEVPDFVGTTVAYVREYGPAITVVHSTVVPGTTRRIAEQVSTSVVYSPVRGKHRQMKEDLLLYTKYVASTQEGIAERVARHLRGAGLRTHVFSSVEGLELAKLLETTYFGVLLAWVQEMERFCRTCGADYDEVVGLLREIDYLPPVIFQPGFVGGHCVIPNTYLLERVRPSAFLDLIRASNEEKREEWLRQGRSLEDRLRPQRIR